MQHLEYPHSPSLIFRTPISLFQCAVYLTRPALQEDPGGVQNRWVSARLAGLRPDLGSIKLARALSLARSRQSSAQPEPPSHCAKDPKPRNGKPGLTNDDGRGGGGRSETQEELQSLERVSVRWKFPGSGFERLPMPPSSESRCVYRAARTGGGRAKPAVVGRDDWKCGGSQAPFPGLPGVETTGLICRPGGRSHDKCSASSLWTLWGCRRGRPHDRGRGMSPHTGDATYEYQSFSLTPTH